MSSTMKKGDPGVTVLLRQGEQLVVTTAASSAAIVERSSSGVAIDKTTIAASSASTFGEYLQGMTFQINCLRGTLTYAVSQYTGCRAKDAVDSLAQLHISGDGAPVNALQAALIVNPAGDDNALTFTAVEYGANGNALSVAYVDPGANNAALAVSVSYGAITVSLATGVAGAITSTAAQVKAAVEALAASAALVTVAVYTADTGIADDGSGVVTAMASAALAGGVGTGVATVVGGGLYSDYTNSFVYRNSGTQAAPTWAKLADA